MKIAYLNCSAHAGDILLPLIFLSLQNAKISSMTVQLYLRKLTSGELFCEYFLRLPLQIKAEQPSAKTHKICWPSDAAAIKTSKALR